MSETKTTTTSSQSGSSFEMADHPFIKNKIEQIKADDEFRNENDLRMSDRRRSNIMDIAIFLEEHMSKHGAPSDMIKDISTIITRIFEKQGLEKYSYLILEVLPDKYKNKNKDQYRNNQSRLIANRIKRHLNEIQSLNLSLLEPDDLYEIKNLSLSVPDSIEKELETKKLPYTQELGTIPTTAKGQRYYSELENLKDLEKNKFKKANISEPLSTVEKLCAENPEYAKRWPELAKEMDQSVRGMEITRDWFTKYPPLTIDLLDKLTQGYRIWNEYWRPFYDKKYRRDHNQSVKTAYMRVMHTSTKASHESQIPCAHHLDKNGLPVMRGLTKEQIDAMFDWEINFNQEFLNTVIRWPQLISEVNASHGTRCMEDRAINLSDTLSHHA